MRTIPSDIALTPAVKAIQERKGSRQSYARMERSYGWQTTVTSDLAEFFKDLSVPFYGANRPGANVSQGLRDSFWLQGMQAGFKAVFDCIKAFSETDFTEDLKKFDVPTLIIHGDDNQIVPIGASAMHSSKLIKDARLELYKGAPHGLCSTEKERVNADLLSFAKS